MKDTMEGPLRRWQLRDHLRHMSVKGVFGGQPPVFFLWHRCLPIIEVSQFSCYECRSPTSVDSGFPLGIYEFESQGKFPFTQNKLMGLLSTTSRSSAYAHHIFNDKHDGIYLHITTRYNCRKGQILRPEPWGGQYQAMGIS